MRVELFVETFVIFKLAISVHQAMREHEQFQLFVVGVGDEAVAEFGKRRIHKLHKTNNQSAGFFAFSTASIISAVVPLSEAITTTDLSVTCAFPWAM